MMPRLTLSLTAAALVALTGGCQIDRDPGEKYPLEETPVFTSGQEGYHTFRIPAIIVTQQGTLLAFCEGRKNSQSDHGDLDLVLKRSHDGGRSWGPLELVYEEGGNAEITIGNPCVLIDQDTGTIWLPFCRDNDDVLITSSTDDGRSWSKPVEITDDVKKLGWGWYATGPGVGIQLEQGRHKGRMVIPCDHREKVNGETVEMSHVFYSDDHGLTWKLGGSVPRYTDECQVIERMNGDLLINMRNYWERHGKQPEKGCMRTSATSSDGGKTWSELRFEKTLIEPVCQASLLRYTDTERHDKDRLLFSNPASREERILMTVRLSYDEGETWPVAKTVYAGPSAYSCLTVLPDMTIGCLYERGVGHAYETITFARIPLEWLTDGADRVPVEKD